MALPRRELSAPPAGIYPRATGARDGAGILCRQKDEESVPAWEIVQDLQAVERLEMPWTTADTRARRTVERRGCRRYGHGEQYEGTEEHVKQHWHEY